MASNPLKQTTFKSGPRRESGHRTRIYECS